MIRLLVVLISLLVVACDREPPCHPGSLTLGGGSSGSGREPGPVEPPPESAMSDSGDDEGHSRNADGEVCRCSLSRDHGCTTDPDGVVDSASEDAPRSSGSSGGASTGQPQGVCGKTFWGCADVYCGDGASWAVVDEPICPRAYGGAETRAIAAGIMAGMMEEWAEGRPDCRVRGVNAHDAPIGNVARCGFWPSSPTAAPN